MPSSSPEPILAQYARRGVRSRSECGYYLGTESPMFAGGPLGCYAMARTDAGSQS